MGSTTYLVTGRGEPTSYRSASHGAGRTMSRTQAERDLDVETFEEQMAGRAWLSHRSRDLIDEAPGAYKDIDEVMRAQADLVVVDHELRQVLNFKGV